MLHVPGVHSMASGLHMLAVVQDCCCLVLCALLSMQSQLVARIGEMLGLFW